MTELKIYPESNPLSTLEDDYTYASLTIAWNWDSGNQIATLLFGTIELLPNEFPKPDAEPVESTTEHFLKKRLGGKSKHTIFKTKQTLNSIEAVKLYINIRSSSGSKIEIDYIKIKDNTLKLHIPSFAEEPIWPNLVTQIHDGQERLPFLQYWHEQPRMHHLLSEDGLPEWSSEEEIIADSWLTEKLHFEWPEYDEFHCSFHLIALDPIFRSVKFQDSPKESIGKEGESIRFVFVLRSDKTFENIKLWITEKRPTGFGQSWETVIDENIIDLEFGQDMSTFKYEIICPKRGVLSYRMENYFISSAQIGLNIGSKTRSIVKNDEKIDEITISDYKMIEAGEKYECPPGIKLLAMAKDKHNSRRKESRYGQQWFIGQETEGKRFVKKLFATSHKTICIVDPYFSENDIAYLFLVPDPQVEISVLTSHNVLKKISTNSETELKNIRGIILHKTLMKVKDNYEEDLNSISIKVLRGENSPIHDRFIIIDDTTVWHLGSSLNKFGKRGVLVMKVPYPDPILKEIECHMNDKNTIELDEWIIEQEDNAQ